MVPANPEGKSIAENISSCPLCDGTRRLPLSHYSVEPWQLVQCEDCSFVYLKNPPSYDRLVTEFAYEKTSLAETERRKAERPVTLWIDHKTRWRLTLFGNPEINRFRRIFAPGRVLDVGCGLGYTIPEPFTPFGVEVSEALARVANARMEARGGRTIHAPAVEGVAQFPDCHFTGVILRGMLEHETQPKMLLRQVKRVLTDSGTVYVKVPNYGGINRRIIGRNWCGFRHPEHVNYFTHRSLRKLTADCGLRLEILNAHNLLNDSIKAVLRKS
jgi:SAM-dependent methyltransferase